MRKLILLLMGIATPSAGQQQPPIRQITKLERTSPDSIALASARSGIPMPGGRVLINDPLGRRVLLFDSTLTRATVVADTTGATGNSYDRNGATLVRYRGDSALLIVPGSLSMFVIAPNGTIARTKAMPGGREAYLLNDAWANLGIDKEQRIVYPGVANVLPGMFTIAAGAALYEGGKPTRATVETERMLQPTDSAALVRANLETRVVDTIASIRIPKFRRKLKADDQGRAAAVETTPDPLPVLDLPTMLSDGTLAIVRGSDFHIDWIDASGHTSASSKLPFDWKKVDEARKRQLIDSTVQRWRAMYEQFGSRGGRIPLAPQVVTEAAPGDLPDYTPPFSEHAVDSDTDDNIWIRTTTQVDGRPVYDIVNRRGVLIDRVQLPAHRAVVGFGAGVIYTAVETADGKVRLERMRLR